MELEPATAAWFCNPSRKGSELGRVRSETSLKAVRTASFAWHLSLCGL